MPQKLKIERPYDPAIPLLGIYPEEIKSLSCRDVCTWKFTAVLLIITKTWKQPAAAAQSLQLCLTLCDPIDGNPPGSAIPGILQARILEWVAISFSTALKWEVKVKSLSRVQLLATPWTAPYQAPASMGFSRRVLEWVAIAFSRKQPKCPLIDGGIMEMWYVYKMEYYSTIKKKGLIICNNVNASGGYYAKWNKIKTNTACSDLYVKLKKAELKETG